ncbi:MAG TPA: PqqD family protein [Gemmatimonadales bacterium]|nr:PqqD family protein [Gemmatimonadales bacterium]
MLPTPNPAVLFQPVAEGAILLHTEQEIYFGLNEVGALVWQLLPPHSKDLSEVLHSLGQRYPEVDIRDIELDVSGLLEELAGSGLVVPAE